LLSCVFGIQSSQNTAILYEEKVTTAESNLGNNMQRRADLIPNLVDCVKQYDKHEYETLMAVVEARCNSQMSESTATEIKNQITAVAESYPQLESSTQYQNLMNELSITENSILEYRNTYNSSIENYNRFVKRFPTRVFLNITGYEVKTFSKLTYSTNQEAPKNIFGE